MRRVLLLACILLVTPAAAQAPDGVHLHWRDDLDQYAVRFHGVLPQQQNEYEVAYTVDGQEHQADITVTSPGYGRSSVYGFRMPADATAYRIDDRRFEVQAPPPAADGTVRIAFLADIGMTDNTQAVLDAVRAHNVSAIIAGGDLSYADGDVAVWDQWMTFMESYVSDIPIFTARGNHEARCLGRGGVSLVADCYTDESIYLSRFDLPLEKLYYATEWGPLRMISVDTEAYYHRVDPVYSVANIDPDVQVEFLEEALRAPDDIWTIVFMHRPTYSSNGAHGSELGIRAHMEPALVRGGADLVLAGHDHAYERSWPVAFGVPAVTEGDTFVAGTPIHVMSGGGGRSVYSTWQPAPVWSAVREAAFHFTLIEADADRLTVRAIALDGREIDNFTLLREALPERVEANASPVPVAAALLGLGVAWAARRRQ